MADDLTKLVFEIEERGAASVEKRFRNIEDSLVDTLKQYQRMSDEADGSTTKMFKNAGAIRESLSTLEKGIVSAGKAYGGMFSGGKIRKQEQRLRGLQKEYDKINQMMTTGDEQSKKAAQSRMADLKKAIDFEASETTRVFQKHKQEFDKIVAEEKKTIGQLTKEGMGGLGGLVGDLRGGDIKGAGQRLGGGIQNLGQQAGKRGVNMEMAGGNAKMGQMLKTFAKVAGPLAMAAGALSAVVAAFVALDSKITEVNKSMLSNISLVEMSGTQFSNMKDQIAGAEVAMAEFRDVTMTDMDLRMLGLDEGEMGQILSTMNEQGMLLGDLQQQGVGYAEALEVAQIAALNLGTDASETAGLIGQLADVTSQSFDEAAASLTQIVSFAQEAGINTKKFFSVVQNVVGEMGLYNYKVTETAALFSKLTNIMDAKSAEEFTNQLSSAIRDMSALERTSMVVVNGMGKVAEMADKTQKRLQEGLNPDKMMSAFEKIGMEEIFEKGDINSAMKQMTRTQRNALQSAISDVDQATGEEFRKYRNVLEANRNDVMELQGVLADFALGDQIQLQIGDIEGKLGMPLENINSVLAESQGVSEAQLRMLKAVKSDLSGDMERLRMASDNEEEFKALAEEMGYDVTVDQLKEMKNFTDLMHTMTEKKQGELIDSQKDQKTLAEKSAEMQRSMLDTLKYKLMDLVSGIYRAILDIHGVIQKLVGGGPDESEAMRREVVEKDFDLRRKQRKVEQMAPGEAKVAAEKQLELEQAKLRDQEARVAEVEGIDSVTLGGRAVGAREAVEMMEKEGVFKLDELESLLQARAQGEKKVKGVLERTEGKAVGSQLTVNTDRLSKEKRTQKIIALQSGQEDQVSKKVRENLEKGAMSQEALKNLQDEQLKVLKDSGIKIKPEAMKELADRFVQAQYEAEILRDVQAAGLKGPRAMELAKNLAGGNREAINTMSMAPGERQMVGGLIDKFAPKIAGGVKKAKDARIVNSGIPLLDLQAGDIIVDQEALASTLAGGRGDYVPDLMRQVASKSGGGGGGGGGATLNAHFYINGGNPQEVRSTVMKVLQEWERKRSMS